MTSNPLLHLRQIAKERASVYALDEDTNQWRERGTSGKILMYQHDTEADDVRIKWEPSSNNHDASAIENWWRLTSSKLKPKSERALVLKAWCMTENQQETLAIRFASQRVAIEFAKKYRNAKKLHVDIENIFETQNQNGSSRAKNGSMLSEPASGDHNNNADGSSEPWKCIICTYQNATSTVKCQMCGCNQPSKDGVADGVEKWRCPACTFSNHPHSKRCEVCQALRPGVVASGDDNEDGGGCGGNGGGKGESYNQIPDKKPPAKNGGNGGGVANGGNGGGHHGQWQCGRCTLYNPNETPRCAVCGAARDGDDDDGGKVKPRPVPEVYDDRKREYRQGMNHNEGTEQAPPQQQQQAQKQQPQKGGGVQLQRMRKNVSQVTEQDLHFAASDIACYNHSPSAVFSTLRSVAKRLLRGDARYLTLDTANPKVMERLIGFEGVLGFLQLLGFESDAVGAKLICKQPPPMHMVNFSIEILNRYHGQYRFRMTDDDDGYGNSMARGDCNRWSLIPSQDTSVYRGLAIVGRARTA